MAPAPIKFRFRNSTRVEARVTGAGGCFARWNVSTSKKREDNEFRNTALESSPPLSRQELRLVIRHNDNGIAIEAFEHSHVRVQAGRIDADKHWGAAVWARMDFNFVGREAKQRIRCTHISLHPSMSAAIGHEGPIAPDSEVTPGGDETSVPHLWRLDRQSIYSACSR